MVKNFFEKFDESTLVKLELFENYFKEWLPVFISNAKKFNWKEIFIYDFFSGAGKDSEGKYGSPLIILSILIENLIEIEKNDLKVNILLNEYEEEIYKKLVDNSHGLLANRKSKNINLIIENKDFKELFDSLYPDMILTSNLPRFMFLDQFGFKQITNDVFLKLISLQRNDFLFFISSFNVRRFAELPEFKNYLSIQRKDFDKVKPYHAHRIVFEFYKSLITNNYIIAPFSLQKSSNIHGLIFGSNHTLGIEKFLKVAWDLNKNTGDANYNIDGEGFIDGKPSLFPEDNKIKKLNLLESQINDWIAQDMDLKTIYIKTFEFGCLPKHTNEYLKSLILNKKIKISSKLFSFNIHKLEDNIKITKL